ncbi:acetyl esterase/lipase [Streptomyces auratus]
MVCDQNVGGRNVGGTQQYPLGGLGIQASVFRYSLNARHPAPPHALRAEIRQRRARGADRIGLVGFSAGGHLAGLAALAPGAEAQEAVQFAHERS